MDFTKKYAWLLGCLMIIVVSSCKKWDDHTAVTNQALNETLTQEIAKHTELSKFNDYLIKTGLDQVLASSKNYTVFAPNNDALATLDAATIADTSKLKAYLLNHISGELFFTRMGNDSLRLPMLNGKRIFTSTTKFDVANIKTADIYVKNGVLNVIDQGIAPLGNAWDYITTTTATFTQNAYVAALNYQILDPSQATLDSINPATGDPVYKAGTGIIIQNSFRAQVYDVSNEDTLYTYVILANTAYTTEVNKQKPFFLSTNATYAASNPAWNVVKDLAIKGLYQPAQLANALSKFGAHVSNSAAIIETHKVSNGVVYVVNAATWTMPEKIPTVVIQGETPYALKFNSASYLLNIYYRQRFNPLTNLSFNDIYAGLGSSGANFYIDYTTNGLLTGKYKMYWVALNDKVISGQGDNTYGTDSTLKQILQVGNFADSIYAPTVSDTTAIKPYTYTETYIGDYTNGTYDWPLAAPNFAVIGKPILYNASTKKVRILAPATQTSTIPYNLTLDYIKFVPQF